MNRNNWTRGDGRPVRKIIPGRVYSCNQFWDRAYSGHEPSSNYRVFIANKDDEIRIKKIYDDETVSISVMQTSEVQHGPFTKKNTKPVDFIVNIYDLKERCL